MKNKVVCLFVTVAAGLCLAAAQSSVLNPAPAKSGKDPLQSATKPLTPKSAMSAPHKSPPVAPNTSTSTRKTDAELNHLEHQNIKAPSTKSGTAAPAKRASAKPAAASSTNGSGINATYQKPRIPKN
jgi:hypothetical protein